MNATEPVPITPALSVVIIGRNGDLLSGVALTTRHHDGNVDVGTGPWDPRNRPSFAR